MFKNITKMKFSKNIVVNQGLKHKHGFCSKHDESRKNKSSMNIELHNNYNLWKFHTISFIEKL